MYVIALRLLYIKSGGHLIFSNGILFLLNLLQIIDTNSIKDRVFTPYPLFELL